MIQENFVKLYESSFKENWEMPVFTDYITNKTLSYGEYAAEIAKLHLLFEEMGLVKGDKVSLIGRNNISWAVTYMAVVT